MNDELWVMSMDGGTAYGESDARYGELKKTCLKFNMEKMKPNMGNSIKSKLIDYVLYKKKN